MASSVQIRVDYDDSQVNPGVNRTINNLNQLGNAGQRAGTNAGKGMRSFATDSQKARDASMLMNRLLGVELPRSMTRIIAQSKVLGPAMAGMLNVAIIGTAIQGLVQLGTEISKLSNSVMGNTQAVQDYYKDLVKENEDLFHTFTTRSLGQQMVKTATQAAGAANRQKESAGELRTELAKGYAVNGQYGQALTALVLGSYNYVKAADAEVTAEKRQNEAVKQLGVVTQEYNNQLQQARGEIALIGKQGYAKIAQEEANSLAEVNLKFRAGTAENQTFSALVAQKASRQRIEFGRQEVDESRKQWNEMMAIGLKGVAQISSKEQVAYEELDIQRKRSIVDEQTYMDRRVIIHQTALREIGELLKTLDEETRTSIEAANAYGLEGLNRITAETQNKLADLKHKFDEVWSSLPDSDPAKQRALTDAAVQRYNIEREAATDRDKYIRDSTRETEKMETEAASATLDGWRKTYFDIVAGSNERLQAIRDDLNRGVIDETTAARREAAVRRQTNGEIAREHKQLVEDIASQYESLFDDITSGNLGKRILKNMEHFFALILAEWTTTTRGMGSAAGGVGVAGGGGGTGLAGGLASILFGGGGGGGGMAGGGGGAGAGGGTPPFIPGNSFMGGATGINNIGNVGMAGIGGMGGGTGGGVGGGGFGGGILGTVLGGRGGALSSTPRQAAMGLGIPALAGLAGNKLGGMPGAIGAGVGALGIAAAMGNPAALSMVTALGLSPALVAGAAGAGVGFGIGMGHGKLAGSLSGIGAGAITGFLVGGPIGALIGGIAGLLGGLFGGWFGGSKRKKQAEKLSTDFIAQINQTVEQFKSYELDGAQAIGQVEAIKGAAWDNLSKLKGEGKSVYNHQILPAVSNAEAEINRMQTERDRRSGLVFGPPQFHTGGKVHAAIGGYRAGQDEILAVLKRGEIIMNDRASQKNEARLNRMNAGMDDEGGGGQTVVIKALDSSDVKSWVRNGGGKQLFSAFRSASAEGGY